MNNEHQNTTEAVAVGEIADVGTPAAAADSALIEDLAVANRILYRYKVVDAFGHVSIRHPNDPNRFLLARNMAPASVTAGDIIEFDLDGSPVNARGRGVYLERFIHGEIYASRPDVMAVVHSHAPAVVPFGIVRDAKLKPVWHMSGFLGLETPVFEIRDHAGDCTDLLIRSTDLGRALAGELGDKAVVLMRGHGATVVGTTLKQAVYQSIFTQLNAELQLSAGQLGEPVFLTEGECIAAGESVGGQVDRAWNLWRQEAGEPS